MHESLALNEMKFKCGICSKLYAISGTGRTVQGKITYFRNSESLHVILVRYVGGQFISKKLGRGTNREMRFREKGG